MIKLSIDRQIMQKAMSEVADQLKNKIDLNLNHIKKLCKEKYGIEMIVGVENKDANMVVFKDQIACKLDFEVRFPMSVVITTKENSNKTLSENDTIMSDIDDLPDKLDDMPEDLDEIMAKELDEIMAEDLDDVPEVLAGIKEELDMNELKEEYLIDDSNNKPIKSS